MLGLIENEDEFKINNNLLDVNNIHNNNIRINDYIPLELFSNIREEVFNNQ